MFLSGLRVGLQRGVGVVGEALRGGLGARDLVLGATPLASSSSSSRALAAAALLRSRVVDRLPNAAGGLWGSYGRSVSVLGGGKVDYLQRRWASTDSEEVATNQRYMDDDYDVEVTSENIDPRLKEVYKMITEQDLDEAIVLCHQLLLQHDKTDPEFQVKVLLIIANCHLQKDDPEVAIKYFRKVLTVDEKYHEYVEFAVARCHVTLENFEEAEKIFTELLKTSPARVECLLERARAYQEMNKEAEAIKDYNEALTIAPNNLIAVLGLAKLFADKQSFGEAYQWYSKAVEIDPNCAIAHSAIALIHLNNQDVKAAIQAINKAVEISGEKDPTVLNQRASMYLIDQQFEKCVEDCDKAIALEPNFGLAYYSRAEALYFMGRWKLSALYYEQFLQKFPQYQNNPETPFADIYAHLAVAKLHLLSIKWLLPDMINFIAPETKEQTPEAIQTKKQLQDWEKALKEWKIEDSNALLSENDKFAVQDIAECLAESAKALRKFGGDVLYEDLGRLFYALVNMVKEKPVHRRSSGPMPRPPPLASKSTKSDVKK